jgi:hypothetical protein
MFLIVLIAILAVIMIAAVPRIRRKLSPDARQAMSVAGHLLTRNGDAMNTSISRALMLPTCSPGPAR